jgi:hypothetical protein
MKKIDTGGGRDGTSVAYCSILQELPLSALCLYGLCVYTHPFGGFVASYPHMKGADVAIRVCLL